MKKENLYSVAFDYATDRLYSAKTIMGVSGGISGAVLGAAKGAILTHLFTAFDNNAHRRKELKRLRDIGRLTELERVELNDLVTKRSKQKWTGAKVGAAIGGTLNGVRGVALGGLIDAQR